MAGPSYNVTQGGLATASILLISSGVALVSTADSDIRMALGFGLAALGVWAYAVKEIIKYFMYKAGNKAPADEPEE